MLYRLLVSHGVTQPWSELDGDAPEEFEYRILAAVIEFQKSRGLVDDGVVGPVTWSHLALPEMDEAWQHVLRIALEEAYRGAREIGGNNKGEWVEKYSGGLSGQPWCVYFASWCYGLGMFAVGLKPPVTERASSSRLYNNNRKLQVPMPRGGDYCIVLGGGTGFRHTAIVSHTVGNTVYVVEGNVPGSKWMPWKRDLVRVGRYKLRQCVFVRGTA